MQQGIKKKRASPVSSSGGVGSVSSTEVASGDVYSSTDVASAGASSCFSSSGDVKVSVAAVSSNKDPFDVIQLVLERRMNMVKNLTEMKLNESIETKDAMPGFEGVMGDNIKLVGISYHLLGDSELLQTVNAWAKGFKPDDYNMD